MKVLLLTPNFYPEKTGIGVSATESACFIADLDNEVGVITCLPHYPEWKILPEYRGKILVTEKFEKNITVKRAWLFVPKKVVTWSRILHELTFAGSTALIALFQKSDLLLSISPPLSASVVLSVVAKLKRKPYWCYIQDIQPDAAICLGMLKNPFLLAISRFLERWIYRHANKLLVLSDGMKQNLVRKGVPDEKITILPLAVNVDKLEARPSAESIFRTTYGLENAFVVLYSGNIGIKHNPQILVECAKKLAGDKSIFFAIIGEGAAKAQIEEEITKLGLTNIALWPLCERKLLGDMLQSADILVVPQRKEVLDIVVPSKIVAYLTSKKPIIASVHPKSEAAVLLKKHNAGLVIAPEDAEALAEAICTLRDDTNLANELGENGYRLVREQFHTDVVREKFYKPLFSEEE